MFAWCQTHVVSLHSICYSYWRLKVCIRHNNLRKVNCGKNIFLFFFSSPLRYYFHLVFLESKVLVVIQGQKVLARIRSPFSLVIHDLNFIFVLFMLLWDNWILWRTHKNTFFQISESMDILAKRALRHIGSKTVQGQLDVPCISLQLLSSVGKSDFPTERLRVQWQKRQASNLYFFLSTASRLF